MVCNKVADVCCSKLKQWEKERRERLNVCFRELASLLPSHDPAVTLSKVQILQKAAKYIRELQGENKTLVEDGASEVSDLPIGRNYFYGVQETTLWAAALVAPWLYNTLSFSEATDTTLWFAHRDISLAVALTGTVARVITLPLKQLQVLRQRSDDLLRRVQQLVELLQDAGIAVPSAVSLKSEPFKERQLKWDCKIKPENAKILEEKAKEKKSENKKKVQKWKKRSVCDSTGICVQAKFLKGKGPAQKKSKTGSTPNTSSCPSRTGRPQEQPQLPRDENRRPVKVPRSSASLTSIRMPVPQNTPTSSYVHIAGPGANSGKNVMVSVSNSALLTGPVVSPSMDTRPGLVPGTLIFTSGSIVPVLPAPQAVITTPAQYIVNTGPQVPVLHKSPIVLLQKNAPPTLQVSNHKKGKTYPLLIPKKRTDSAKAKFPNKVAISASASQYLPLQVQSSENTTVSAGRTSTNKRTLNVSHKINTDHTNSSKEKSTRILKRRKAPVVPNAVEKYDNASKQDIICEGVSNQVADAGSANNNTEFTDGATAKSVEMDMSVITDSGVTECSKENSSEDKMQICTVEKMPDRRTKKRIISKEMVTDLEAENKKLKFSQMMDCCEKSCELGNVMPIQSGSVVNIAKASDKECLSHASTATQQVDSSAVVSFDNPNVSHSDSSITSKLPDDRQQGDCVQGNSMPPDTDTDNSKDTSDGAPQKMVSSVCESSNNPTVSTNIAPVASSSVCMSNDSYTTSARASNTHVVCEGHLMQGANSNPIHECTNTVLQEKVVEASSNKHGDSSLVHSIVKDGQSFVGENDRVQEEGTAVCDTLSHDKSQQHVTVNDKSATSGTEADLPKDRCSTENFPSPAQVFAAFDEANMVTGGYKRTTQGMPVLFDSGATQELSKFVENGCCSESTVSAGPVLNTASEELQSKVCIEGASKKNMFGIYTIDALCKTSISESMDVELGKDVPQSVPLQSNTEETITSGVERNNCVVNSDSRSEGTEKIVPKECINMQTCSYDDSNVLGKLNTTVLESIDKICSTSAASSISMEVNHITASQNSSSISEGSSPQVVPSAERTPGFPQCDVVNVHLPSFPETTRNNNGPVLDGTSDMVSAPEQQDVARDKPQPDSSNSKVTEQISAQISETACTSENSTGVSMPNSNQTVSESVKKDTINTAQNCVASNTEIQFQGRELSAHSMIGEKPDEHHNKQNSTSQSTDAVLPAGKVHSTAPSLYASSANVLPDCPTESGENCTRPSYSVAHMSDVKSKHGPDKPHGELICGNADVPICDVVHNSMTASYEKTQSAAGHVNYSLTKDTHAHSEIQHHVKCSTADITNMPFLHNHSTSVCNFTSGINTQLHPIFYSTSSMMNGRCSSAAQYKTESSVSAPTTFTPVPNVCTQSKAHASCSTTSNKFTSSSIQEYDSAGSAHYSFAPVHSFPQKQPYVPYSTSGSGSVVPLSKQETVVSQRSSVTSVVHTLPQTQPQLACPASNCNFTSLMQKPYESTISSSSVTSAVHMLSQTQPHVSYAAGSDKCYLSLQQKQECVVSVPNSLASVHSFPTADVHVPYCANSGKSSLQHKNESVFSMPLSFTPGHTYSLSQPQITSNKCSSSLQQTCESAVSATNNSFVPVHIFSQAQSQVAFSSTSANCNLSLSHKHGSVVSEPSTFVPVHTFSQAQPSVSYSSSDKCNLSSQHKHESTATFAPVISTAAEPQAGVVTATSSLPFSDRQFPTSTFTPVSQIMSDIRTHVSGFPNLNSTSAGGSWRPASGHDNSWLSTNKPPNSLTTAPRKASSGNETVLSSANLSLQTNEFPNDIFASLQVPSGGQHPESISPTAAFLLAFPLVSSSKVSDMIDPQDVDCDSLHGASSLLQIGNIDHYSTPKKDMSVTSSTIPQASSQPLASKCQMAGKGHSSDNVMEREKSLADKEIYLANQLPFVHENKQDLNNKNGINVKSTAVSTSTNKMMEDCGKQNNANRSIGTQFKSTDVCEAKPITSTVSKQYVPTSFHASYSSANTSAANATSVTANTSTTNSQTEHKINTSVDNHPMFSSTQTYEASSGSMSSQLYHSQDQQKENNENIHFPVISKGQNFDSSPTSEFKWSHHKSDACEKRNTTGSFTGKKLDVYKAGLSSHNSGGPTFESSQICPATISGASTSQCVSSAMSNPSYNHNFFQESGHRGISSQGACMPTYNGGRRTGVSLGSAVSGVLPWSTLVTTATHSSMSSTAQSVVSGTSHQCPATQHTLPRAAVSTANCHYGVDPRYTLLSKPATAASNGVGSSTKNLDDISSKLSDHCNDKFVKNCEQKVPRSGHQHTVGDGIGPFGSSTVTAAMSSETADPFKFTLPLDQHQVYQQHMHRPPVNWMTAPAVTTSYSKQTFNNYFSMPSMDIPSSTQLDEQQLRNSSYITMANLNSSVFTPSTSTCYGNKTLSQNPLGQVKLPSEKQQSVPASVSYANETQNDFSRLALQNNSINISQIQQNEFYSAPWTQIKPPFPADVASSDVNSLYVPSTLPTLVGDLALGTGCIVNTMEENNANKSFSNSEYTDIGQHTKEQKMETNGRLMKNRQAVKDLGRKSKHNMDCSHDFGNLSHTVSSSVGGTFLSVSQLVDPMKSAADTSGCQSSLHGYNTSSNQTAASGKHLRHHTAGLFAKRESLPQSTLNSKEDVKKAEHPHNVASSLAYQVKEMPQAIPSEHAKRENSKSGETSTQKSLDYQSAAAAENFHWLPSDASSRKQARVNATNYKTQLSTYSAEALIGNNQTATVNGSTAHNISHKVISLPPPVVSDRFHNQNSYVGSHAPRKTPYGDNTLHPGGYNIRPLDLPMSQNFTIQTSSVANHPGHQTYTGNAPRYSTVGTLEPPVHRRENGGVCPAPYFPSSVRDSSANPTAQGFMPDIVGSSYGLRAPDGKKSVSFPTFSFSKESCPPKSEKQNLIYSQPVSSSSSINQHTGHVRSKMETSSGVPGHDLSSEKTASSHSNTRQSIGGVMQNVAGGNCVLGRQRGRKRAADATTSVSSVGNLVDLGYLTMPPGIGSPMLGDDAMYFSHGANFHSGPAALYPGGPPGAQGSFYTPPRAPFPPCSTAPRSLQQATASPNTGGTTLANFNLSTIFPEIVDKQASSAADFPAKPAEGDAQHAQRPPMGTCAAGVPSYPHVPPTNLNTFPHTNPSAARTHVRPRLGVIISNSSPQHLCWGSLLTTRPSRFSPRTFSSLVAPATRGFYHLLALTSPTAASAEDNEQQLNTLVVDAPWVFSCHYLLVVAPLFKVRASSRQPS
ncbi:hypothetical protein PR048_031096 [Dryococelus australis]|uniref:BHLH domain-containing protein n=1 Tax=Dryococelus australis TaxID=614101 RepID=A0ABQ9G4A6_9NEOP|nr:hypothetical protein PR048_031096 [Dryococelus australis]